MKHFRSTASHIVTAVVTALVVVACAKAASPERDNAHQSRPDQINSDSPYLVQMPNYFNNVAFKCDVAGNLVYVTSNKTNAPSNLYIVPDAKFCQR